MKTLAIAGLCLAGLVAGTTNTSYAQFFKKLKEGVSKAAEETIQRKAEQKASKKTGQAFDSVFNRPPEQKSGNRNTSTGEAGTS